MQEQKKTWSVTADKQGAQVCIIIIALNSDIEQEGYDMAEWNFRVNSEQLKFVKLKVWCYFKLFAFRLLWFYLINLKLFFVYFHIKSLQIFIREIVILVSK